MSELSAGAVALPSEFEKQVMGKVMKRLIPFLMFCFFIAFLDRVNVGFAAIAFKKDLALSDSSFGLGAGLFFIAYFLFEVPSNVILNRVGARVWIARIMFTWGIISGCMALVVGESSYYFVRLLLGAAEAGFFPGVILYLTFWFPAAYRARVVGYFMVAIPISTIIGAPLSGWLLGLDGFMGLKGWQWMFIIEALPALLLTFVVLGYLTDKPKDAKWLTADERRWLQARLDAEQAQRESVHKLTLWQAISHPRILLISLIYVGAVASNYGMSFWLPQIVKNFGLSNLQTGFVTAIPYVFGAMGLVFWGRHSDQTGERTWHVAGALLLACAGLAASAFMSNPYMMMAVLSVAALGIFGVLPCFWTLPTSMLSGVAAAGGIAAINSIGNLAGFGGPYMIGWIRENYPNGAGGIVSNGTSLGLLILAAIPLIGAIIAISIGHDKKMEKAPPIVAPAE